MDVATVESSPAASATAEISSEESPKTLPPLSLATNAVIVDTVLQLEDLVDKRELAQRPSATFVVNLNAEDSDAASVSDAPVDGKTGIVGQRAEDIALPSTPKEAVKDVSDAESVDSPVALKHPPGLHHARDEPIAATPSPSPSDEVVPDRGHSAAGGRVPDPEPTPSSILPDDDPLHDIHDILAIDPTVFEDALSMFSLRGVKPLQAFIPDTLLPDDLFVYDVHNITTLQDRDVPSKPVRYVRIYPKSARDSAEAEHAYAARTPGAPVRTAELFLSRRNTLGAGNHSRVFRAPFALRLDPGSQSVSRVSVGVKIASPECGAHEMLRREARMYDAFPRHIMEDVRAPDASSESGERSSPSDTECEDAGPKGEAAKAPSPGDAETSCPTEVKSASTPVRQDGDTPAPGGAQSDAENDVAEAAAKGALPAIVPKFFGYYSPVGEEGAVHCESHADDCDIDSTCSVRWPTSLLLVEECGRPLHLHLHQTSAEARRRCYDLVDRLHDEGFVQNSLYQRNIVIQPGPLSAPRKERSLSRPSFRIIDFGRGETVRPGHDDISIRRWEFINQARYEESKARRELRL